MEQWYGRREKQQHSPTYGLHIPDPSVPSPWSDVVREVRKTWRMPHPKEEKEKEEKAMPSAQEENSETRRTPSTRGASPEQIIMQELKKLNTRLKSLEHQQVVEKPVKRAPHSLKPSSFYYTSLGPNNRHNVARVAVLKDKMKRIVTNTDRQETALRNLKTEMHEVQRELGYLHGDLVTSDQRGTTPWPRVTRTMSHQRPRNFF